MNIEGGSNLLVIDLVFSNWIFLTNEFQSFLRNLLKVNFGVKGQSTERVKFSAFAMFYVICIYLLSVKWLYKIFLILLSVSGDVEINPGPRRKMKLFQSVTGT